LRANRQAIEAAVEAGNAQQPASSSSPAKHRDQIKAAHDTFATQFEAMLTRTESEWRS